MEISWCFSFYLFCKCSRKIEKCLLCTLTFDIIVTKTYFKLNSRKSHVFKLHYPCQLDTSCLWMRLQLSVSKYLCTATPLRQECKCRVCSKSRMFSHAYVLRVRHHAEVQLCHVAHCPKHTTQSGTAISSCLSASFSHRWIVAWQLRPYTANQHVTGVYSA